MYLFLHVYFIDYAITVVPFPPLYSPLPCTPPPTHINFSHLQSTLYLMQYNYLNFFFSAQNSFCTYLFGYLLELLPFFCFTSSTWARRFSLRTFFIGETKRVAQGEIGWIGRVGHRGHATFGQKLLNWVKVFEESSK